MSTFPTLIYYDFEIPSQSNRIGARNKRDLNRERRNQTIPIYRFTPKTLKTPPKKTLKNHKYF
jgi:hypothetical protein